MENKDHKGGFEIFLKEKADQYKLYPSEKVWSNLNSRLHPGKRWPYLGVAIIFLGLGIGGKVYDSKFNSQSDKGISHAITYPLSGLAKSSGLVSNQSVTNSGNNASAKLTSQKGEYHLPGSQPQITESASDRLTIQEQEYNTNQQPGNKLKTPVEEVQSSGLPSGAAITTFQSHEGVINADLIKVQTPNPSVQSSFQTNTLETGSLILSEPVFDAAQETEKIARKQDRASVHDKTMPASYFSLQQASIQQSKIPESAAILNKNIAEANTTAIKVLKPGKNRLGLQLYFTPTISYRKLSGTASKYNNFNSGVNYYSTLGYPRDVNSAVSHVPSMGMELGTAFVYSLKKWFRLKGGLQLNYSQYLINAYNYSAEIAPLSAGGIGHTEINALSFLRNFNGYSKTMLHNEHFMISIPIGAEVSVIGKGRVHFNVAATLQPGLMLDNQAYMISTNLKNYAKEPSLNRNFNLSSAAEAFLSIKSGSLTWVLGPQIRYQLLSSYKPNYPIKEHLYDYGFKVGMTKTLR